MGYPDDPLPDPSTWFSNVLVTAAAIKANIIDALNSLRTIGRGFIGEASTVTSVTLATTGQYIGGATITVTVPTGGGGRRYRAVAKATVQTASAPPARYILLPAFNSGSAVDRNATTFLAGASIVTFGAAVAAVNGSTGAGGSQSPYTSGTVLLNPGTYTFSVAVSRGTGGSATDTAANFYLELEDIGAA